MLAMSFLLACASPPPAVAPAPAEGEPLGAFPLCEPSALVPLDDGAWLVADNEGRPPDAKDGEAGRPSVWVVPAGGAPVPVTRREGAQDVESLLRLGDELWVLGSLSRNKDCERKPKRWEIHVHPVPAWTAEGVAGLAPARVIERKRRDIERIEGSVGDCVASLFRGRAEAEPLCEAIVGAAAGRGAGCDALNVEGAVAVDGRVWLGLRAPLVGGRAALVRLEEGHAAVAFDAVRLVDLGGLGIRELVVDGDRLVGIAGAATDPAPGARSGLFSAPVAGLAAGDLPVTWLDRDLPPTAEAVHLGDPVTYLLDGDAGDGPACAQPAARLSRPRGP